MRAAANSASMERWFDARGREPFIDGSAPKKTSTGKRTCSTISEARYTLNPFLPCVQGAKQVAPLEMVGRVVERENPVGILLQPFVEPQRAPALRVGHALHVCKEVEAARPDGARFKVIVEHDLHGAAQHPPPGGVVQEFETFQARHRTQDAGRPTPPSPTV